MHVDLNPKCLIKPIAIVHDKYMYDIFTSTQYDFLYFVRKMSVILSSL